MNELNFKISSALKNLIGKELITDEFVAVFELVKNSFDANAKRVKVIFENQYAPSGSKITIWDDGWGMSRQDLEDKWLFVGYSAKRDGTEDRDYRNQLKTKRIFAGAKGVGRFSCDRLGANLRLVTKKDGGKCECLDVDWSKFEENSTKEFVNIKVSHQTLDECPIEGLRTGTILEITSLRDRWDRARLLKLKQSLEKLVRPDEDFSNDLFEIEIIAKDELQEDILSGDNGKKVNGIVRNFVFEKLGLKTTTIEAEIVEDGSIIKTALTDRGREIYWVKERNPYTLLSGVKVVLFHLNRAAKIDFKKRVGLEPVKYGSVFIYKNGFRIYPFGEDGDDSLKIDRRKQQGYKRFLGTRDLIGRIVIKGESIDLKETTSRDGGFIKNDTYAELHDFFIKKVLLRLERYVVDVIQWGDPRRTEKDKYLPALNPEDVKKEILNVIYSLTRTNDIVDVGYDPDFLNLYDDVQKKSASRIAKNIISAAEKTKDPVIIKQARAHAANVECLITAKEEAEKEAEDTKAAKKRIEADLEQERKQGIFQRSIIGREKEQILGLQHQISHSSGRIKTNIRLLLDSMSEANIHLDLRMQKIISVISLESEKIESLSNFVTCANFDLKASTINQDLASFIEEYIAEIYLPDVPVLQSRLNIKVVKTNDDFRLRFRPLEITTVIDNFIQNSEKAGAENIVFSMKKNDEKIVISIQDDGKGIPAENISKIFDLGFTTTDGSGIGLFNVKSIVSRLKGRIDVRSDMNKGTIFEVIL